MRKVGAIGKMPIFLHEGVPADGWCVVSVATKDGAQHFHVVSFGAGELREDRYNIDEVRALAKIRLKGEDETGG